MRDWTELLLAVCVVALGAEVVRLEMRMTGIESERSVARSQETRGPLTERHPNGTINGIPYYFTPLGRSGG